MGHEHDFPFELAHGLVLRSEDLSCCRRGRYTSPVSGGGHGIAELLREGAALVLETGPFVSIMETGNRHQLATVEPDQRRIDHVFRRHDNRRGQVLVWKAGASPELGCGRAWQHRLDADDPYQRARAAANG